MTLLERLEMETAIHNMKAAQKEYKQMTELAASQLKDYHNSLLAVGFTEEQSFELVKTHGVNAGYILTLNSGGPR